MPKSVEHGKKDFWGGSISSDEEEEDHNLAQGKNGPRGVRLIEPIEQGGTEHYSHHHHPPPHHHHHHDDEEEEEEEEEEEDHRHHHVGHHQEPHMQIHGEDQRLHHHHHHHHHHHASHHDIHEHMQFHDQNLANEAHVDRDQQQMIRSMGLHATKAYDQDGTMVSSYVNVTDSRYKKFAQSENIALLQAIMEKGRRWNAVTEMVNLQLGTKWNYGRVKHRCRHLMQEKRLHEVNKLDVVDSGNLQTRHVETALWLHKNVFQDRIHRIRSWTPEDVLNIENRPKLVPLAGFTMFKVEVEILRNCNCKYCRKWDIGEFKKGKKEKVFLDEFTKKKAEYLLRVLNAHIEHGMNMEAMRNAMDWGSHWDDIDVEYYCRLICDRCFECNQKPKTSNAAGRALDTQMTMKRKMEESFAKHASVLQGPGNRNNETRSNKRPNQGQSSSSSSSKK